MEQEIVTFYKELLGSAAHQLPCVNGTIMENGPTLTRQQQLQLVQPVTVAEVQEAINSINSHKAPGVDGFNALFFQKTWGIVGGDITEAVMEFFGMGKMCKSINCTSITLIPKVKHPASIREYRPISCCTVLYKIISKILTYRMAKVIHTLVDGCQAAFVPGRVITENILLSHELVKGYARKNISPRCMVKVDLQKAYDSVEWVFIKLTLLDFPQKFVNWVMNCITTVSYSILINGAPTKPFEGRRGLRQGDPLSPFLFVLSVEYLSRLLRQLQCERSFAYHPKCARLKLTHLTFADDLLLFCKGDVEAVKVMFQYFRQFSLASGLTANMSKSSVYMGGISGNVQEQILAVLGMNKGELPFRYLDVPMSTKRLSIAQYQPLINKMLSRVTSWTAKFFSYAGRAQLIRTILFSIQTYWSQIFQLPKKIIQVIERICRVFLWTGGSGSSKKALISWETLSKPKCEGGLNFLNIGRWNKAALCKQLWNICNKKDMLWVKWVHIYYVKNRPVLDIQPKQASWVVQKIFDVKKYFDEAGINGQAVMAQHILNISDVYKKLMHQGEKVEWRKLYCNNVGAPKWLFVGYLALKARCILVIGWLRGELSRNDNAPSAKENKIV